MRTPSRRPTVYDVTTKARAPGDQPPPSAPPEPPPGRRSLREAAAAALTALGRGARRPAVGVTLALIGLGLAAKVVADHFRPPSVDGPALATAGWRASASPGLGRPAAALDGDRKTRWVTRHWQDTDEWFAVDMGQARTFHQVVLDSGPRPQDAPRGWAVYLSPDTVHWGSAVAVGAGRAPLTIIDLGRRSARGIKVVQTGEDHAASWSVCEFTVH